MDFCMETAGASWQIPSLQQCGREGCVCVCAMNNAGTKSWGCWSTEMLTALPCPSLPHCHWPLFPDH